MIVTCPNCAKRYMIDEALLPKEGRQVRCIACQHVWRQSLEVSSYLTNLPFVGFNDDAVAPHQPSSKRSTRIFWLISFSFLILSFSFLIFGRNLIVPLWPSLERYYEIFGLPLSLSGSGLSISNPTFQLHQEGSVEMIMVSGDLTNTSNRVRPIPPLKVIVVGDPSNPKCLKNNKDSGCVLDHWDHRLSEKSLLPSERIHFETVPRPKIEGATRISVEF